MSDVKLSRVQRIKLSLFGYVSVGYRRKPTWKGPIEHFAFRCTKHGLVVDYPHGYWDIGKGTIPVKVDGVLSQLY